MTDKKYLTKRELEVHLNKFCDKKSLKQKVSQGDLLLSSPRRVDNCTELISYKSTSTSSSDVKVSNRLSKYPILDKLGFETSSLQNDCIDIIFLTKSDMF